MQDTTQVDKLLISWAGARRELCEMERADHPDITDEHGRVWVWKSKDLYTHCGNAAPRHMIGWFGLPTQSALDNPNYNLCATCIGGRQRNVSVCKPEWQCSHVICRSVDVA